MMCEFCKESIVFDEADVYEDEDIYCHLRCLPDDWDSGMGRP